MEIRTVRNAFYAKNMQYACSFDSELRMDARAVKPVADGLRVWLQPRTPEKIGAVFHVLDALSVTGVDGRKHDCPRGTIKFIEESLCFRADGPIALVQGRMGLEIEDGTPSGRRKPRIDVTYTGTLRFGAIPGSLFDDAPARKVEADPELGHVPVEAVQAAAWVVPSFFTSDTRYRWLAQVGCVAFGTWTAVRTHSWATLRDVTTRLDVYAAASSSLKKG